MMLAVIASMNQLPLTKWETMNEWENAQSGSDAEPENDACAHAFDQGLHVRMIFS
jgi:hypothetical protein